MKFETIILEPESKPEFPLDLVFKSATPRCKAVTLDAKGGLASAQDNDEADFAVCQMHDVFHALDPAFNIGRFILDIQDIGERVEEVVAVYNHDKTKFGVIGFYYETVS